jgi:polar amino acid transport system substrate-binding protein
MIKNIHIIILTTFLAFSAQVQGKNPSIYLNDLKWPPFFFPNMEQGYVGFGKEVLSTCINRLDYDITFKFLPIKRTHIYMKSGEIDVSIYSYVKQRMEFVHYGKEPLFVSQYGLASRMSDNITIEQLSDLKKYTFGNLAGLSHTKELRDIIDVKREKNEVSEGYDIDAMFGQLLTNPQRFQVMASSKETLKWRAKQLDISNKIKVHDFTIKEKAYYVTVSKFSKNVPNPQQFLTKIDNCIRTLKSTKVYETIAQKYGL